MTKTAIIEYNEADETFLQLFFIKLSVTFKKQGKVSDPSDFIENNEVLKKLSKKSKRLLRDMQEAVKECDALARGEIVQETTYEEFLAELKQIAENENRTHQTV
jgi:hypothetical protein